VVILLLLSCYTFVLVFNSFKTVAAEILKWVIIGQHAYIIILIFTL